MKPMTKEETIPYMSSKLYAAGFSNENFEAAILDRERLSSTAFVNFAIPHTMKMSANRSCIYILINDIQLTKGFEEFIDIVSRYSDKENG